MKNRQIYRILTCILALLLALTLPALADVRKGDRGDSVREVQQKLIALGYLTGSADGIFGNGTEKAVIEFQKAEGLKPTGVVDSETYQRMNKPTARTSFSKLAKLEPNSTYEDNGAGNNGNTIWRLDLSFPRQDWMSRDTIPDPTLSWASSPVDTSNDMNLMPSWNFAKKGQTCFRTYFMTDENNTPLVYYEIYLPDDPTLAGRRWIQISYSEETIICYFNLTYKGNYTNGAGWKLSDVAFESMGDAAVNAASAPAEAPAQQAADQEQVPLLTAAEALNKLSIIGCEVAYDDPDEPEMASIGRNGSGTPVSYAIDCFVEQLPSKFTLTGVSWTFNVQEVNSHDWYWQNNKEGWERAQRGETTFTTAYFNDTQSDGSIATQETLEIYLPDDPSIAGEHWFTVTCEDQQALIRMKFTYKGNYQTGTGWSIEHLSTTVTATN